MQMCHMQWHCSSICRCMMWTTPAPWALSTEHLSLSFSLSPRAELHKCCAVLQNWSVVWKSQIYSIHRNTWNWKCNCFVNWVNLALSTVNVHILWVPEIVHENVAHRRPSVVNATAWAASLFQQNFPFVLQNVYYRIRPDLFVHKW